MYQVVVGTDSTGEFVMLVHPEDELLGGEGVRFRLAFESDDYALAVQAAALVEQHLKTRRAGLDQCRPWQRALDASSDPDSARIQAARSRGQATGP